MRRILVTGSSRGIGKAIGLSLLQKDFHVVFHGKQPSDALLATYACAKKITPNCSFITFDVANNNQSQSVLEQEIINQGAFYGIVLNAGINRDGAFPSLTKADWQDVIQVSLDGFYNILNPLILPMIRLKQGGRIVTLASVSGLVGNRGQVNYSAAKGGVIAATKALALELAKRKITVNCVAPGLIDTEMLTEEIISRTVNLVPMQRLGKPQEVASLVAFLLSDEAGYITRQVISINGGLV